MEPAIPVAPPRKRRSIQVENAVHASRVSTLTIESLGKKMESTPRKSVSPSMLSLDTFSDSIREVLGKNVTLYQKCMVKHEVRPDKFERKIVGLTGCRLYLFIVKTPIKVDQDHSFLDIQALESKKKNQLTITVTDGKPISLVTQDAESDDIDLMITHIGRSLKNIFPLFPIERFIKKMDVQPSDRLRPMMDIMKEIEKKDQGPCGGYSIMYACMCDFHNTPYREEVAWDVDTIYLSQDSRELNLQDFDHLNPKDLVPIIGALENNTWFTKFTASKIRLTSDAQSEILKVMKKNNALEELDLSSTGITVDFVQKLATAILSNSASQLQRIDLSKNSLDDKAMIHFIGSLKNLSKGLVHLDISNTRIIGKGLSKVAESLSQSPTIVQSLHSLNISENPGKGEDMQNLYNFLAQGNNITYLDLSGIDCALDLLCAALLRGSCASLTHLRVARNVFTNKKSKEVIVQGTWKTFFSSVYGLELLDLSGCRIPPEALKEMLLGIACNMHIKNLHLDLSSNDLQSQGGQVLGSCIGNISSITSLDISNNNLNQSIMSLLELVKSNKSVKSLSIGQNFDNIKPKLMAGVMESVVNLIQDESSCIESLSLADSKLRNNLSDIINALGSNVTLTEIDISGNQIGDFGARMLSKALQINCKLRCILWDRNLITAQGFEDIAVALQKNYALRKMPMPINDAAVALQKQGERTESALQKIESLLQRNHSPQKFSSDQAYRLQQGFLISSTQQMVDRLVVQVQDTVNALSLGSTDAYQTDIDQAASVIKDADNSKQLLPHLQRIAVQSLEAGNPVESEVKELTNNLKTTLQTQIKRIVTDMIECTGNQCAGVTADKDFMVELVSGCSDRSTLPKGFTKHLMDGVETDIYNKLSEINLAVAAHISDTVIDGVIETLTGSHKTLMSHLKQKRSENRPASADSKDKELEKVEESEKVPLRISIKADSPGASSKSSHENLDIPGSGNTPNLSNKRKSVHARKMRPPTVIVGSQEDLTAVVTNHKPEKLELDTLGDLPDTSTKLTHIAKSRPRGPQRRRPSARPQENGREASDGLKADEGLDAFFTSNKAAEVGTAHSKKETPKSSKSEKKESGDKGSDKKSDLPPKPITEKPKKGWFGRNTKEQKDQPEEKAKGGIASKLFGKKGSDVKRSSSDKKEKAPQKPEIPVKVEEVSTGTKETPEEEPEIDTKSLTESSTPEATPEKKEEEKETEDTVLEEKKEEPPKRRPPVGGVGIMGGPMNVNLFSEMKTNKRFSTLNADKEERKPTVALLPPGKKSPTSNLPPPFKETAKESPLKPVEETKPEVESKVESKVENPPKVETKEEVPSTEDKASLEDKPEKEDKMERKEDKTERKEDKTERKEDKTERKEDKTEKKEDSESKPAQESKPNPAAKFGGMLNQVKAKPSPSPRTVLRKVGEDSAPSSSSSSSRSSRSSSAKEKESSKESLAKEDVPIETESKQEADSSQSNSGVVVDSATLRLSVGEKIKRLSQKLPDPENQPTSSKSSSLPKNISLKSSVNSEVNENGESGKTDNEKEVEKSKDEKSEDSKHSSDSDKSDTLGESAIETREQLSDQEIMV
ncbi:F-actin-uncapping protein LRRC16A-like isoform X14 [Ostrea edulis]|uniref:F-actin-uncapping protein LRRC16A-like isoform X14 n=1 Tax=Ostrea edulis TaxID=37623 RepID=UPI0024AFB55E|nr:F-actin-uncapping protein LRRC16A-like isoform X14 [Ostrea edulis]